MTDIEIKMMELFCYGCSRPFKIESRRGRPPKYCDDCKQGEQAVEVKAEEYENEEQTKRLIAEAKVDRLERDLKLRGTHISQHKDKW